MPDTLYGVPLEIIKTHHHFGIMIRNFLKVAKFPIYGFLGIKAPGSLNINFLILLFSYKIDFQFSCLTGFYTITMITQVIKNGVFNQFVHIRGPESGQSIPETKIFKIVFFSRFKNSFSLQVIPLRTLNKKCIA